MLFFSKLTKRITRNSKKSHTYNFGGAFIYFYFITVRTVEWWIKEKLKNDNDHTLMWAHLHARWQQPIYAFLEIKTFEKNECGGYYSVVQSASRIILNYSKSSFQSLKSKTFCSNLNCLVIFLFILFLDWIFDIVN